VQIADIHDNTSRLIVGGLGLLGLLTFGVSRVINALKDRKDVIVPRLNHSHAMVCAPASGVGRAPAKRPARSKRNESVAETNSTTVNKETAEVRKPKQITVTGIFKVVGRVKRPALDDQLVYLDE
jgi:hypothetical protein